MVVIGHDPGLVNYGYCVLIKRGNSIVVLRSGQLPMPKYTATALPDFIHKYRVNLRKYLVGNTHAVERFQARGFRSNLMEPINAMIGSLCTEQKKVTMVLPVTWKNSFNRVAPLKSAYKVAKQNKLSPHQLDAFLIAWYVLHGDEKSPFDLFKSKKEFNSYMKQLAEKTVS